MFSPTRTGVSTQANARPTSLREQARHFLRREPRTVVTQPAVVPPEAFAGLTPLVATSTRANASSGVASAHFEVPGATASNVRRGDFFGVPAQDFPPHVIDGLAAILNFGFFPYDGIDPSRADQGFRPTPQLGARPDVADGFRRFVHQKAADMRQAGDETGAAGIEKIAAESTHLDDGRMMFRNGTKVAFHEMPQAPGCKPLIAANFAGMSGTRHDAAESATRFRGDIPTSLRQVSHVVRSVVTREATSNTQLVGLMAEYLRSRPESMFAYGHSMGGAFAEQLSNEIAAWNRENPEATPKRVAFMAFQSATLQASDASRNLQLPYFGRYGETDQREVRCCHVQSPRDLIGQLQGTRAFKWVAGSRVAAPTGTRIDVLRDSDQTPTQQHDRVYQLLASDLQHNPQDLRRLLDHMGEVYRYSSRAEHGMPLRRT
jgi:hypothetical protein